MPNHGHDGWQPTMPGPTTPPPAVRPAHQVPANVQNMSLRDYMAAHSIDAAYHHCRKTGVVEAARIAAYAYDLADAMLKQRQVANG